VELSCRRWGWRVAAILVEELSDDVIELLKERARLRGVEVGTVVRELLHIGLSLGLVKGEARHAGIRVLETSWFDVPAADMVRAGVGVFDTADPELLLS